MKISIIRIYKLYINKTKHFPMDPLSFIISLKLSYMTKLVFIPVFYFIICILITTPQAFFEEW